MAEGCRRSPAAIEAWLRNPRSHESVRSGAPSTTPAVAPAAGPSANSAPVLLTQKLLARRWHISHRTLERWRCEAAGPPYVRLVGRVLYRLEDIERYEREHLCGPGVAR
jgi:hypothetical protein